jgi:hypothetical protein
MKKSTVNLEPEVVEDIDQYKDTNFLILVRKIGERNFEKKYNKK